MALLQILQLRHRLCHLPDALHSNLLISTAPRVPACAAQTFHAWLLAWLSVYFTLCQLVQGLILLSAGQIAVL